MINGYLISLENPWVKNNDKVEVVKPNQLLVGCAQCGHFFPVGKQVSSEKFNVALPNLCNIFYDIEKTEYPEKRTIVVFENDFKGFDHILEEFGIVERFSSVDKIKSHINYVPGGYLFLIPDSAPNDICIDTIRHIQDLQKIEVDFSVVELNIEKIREFFIKEHEKNMPNFFEYKIF